MGRRPTELERLLTEKRERKIASLEAKLAEIESQLDEAVAVKALTWHIGVRKRAIRLRVTSENIALAYAVVCLGALAAGIAFTLSTGTKELGVALVVGAIFAIASFMAQWWAVAATQQQEILDDTYDRGIRERLRKLAQERQEIIDSLVAMDGAGGVRSGERRFADPTSITRAGRLGL
jgi:hypothetical protein